MSMLDEIAAQAEHAGNLAARAGHIKAEARGNAIYLKFYKRVLIPVALGSLLLPVFGCLTSLWAEENAGIRDDQYMQAVHNWRSAIAFSLVGRRGIAVMLPTLVGVIGGLAVAGAYAVDIVTPGQVLAGTEIWTAVNALRPRRAVMQRQT